ncbi:MAG: class I SAM-dependent methyltransferase family protein [Planctomycetota bacterium]|nr:class I SAM-dependent methyltransferase family protein [Planctomycetota bacterium]MDA1212958.1 class I SAM-dependent methyltransferase family protein [Planctomycetota bacterium]
MPTLTQIPRTNLRKDDRAHDNSIIPTLDVETISPSQRFVSALMNPWKNRLLPAGVLRRLLKNSKSPLLAESFQRPGGWRSMQIIYRNDPPVDWFDDQALRTNPVSIASRNRCRIVIQKLSRAIAEIERGIPVNVVGIGSGPGVQIQSAIVNSGIDVDRVTAYLIDLDDDARDFGESVAEQLGLEGCVHFRTGDARQISNVLPDIQAHIAKLVGIVEYLNDEQLLTMLKAVASIMVPNGVLVTHGMVDALNTSRFLTRVFDLTHQHRSAEHMIGLLESAGFRCTDCTVEPTGTYPILTAKRNG